MAKHHESIQEIIQEIQAHGPHHDPAPPPPPPPVVTPPPPPVVTPPPIPSPTTVLDASLQSIGHEFQSAVSELLSGNTAAAKDLTQTAFDLGAVTSDHTGQYGIAAIDVWFPQHGNGTPETLALGFQDVAADIKALAQPGITASATNDLLWDIGQLTSSSPVSNMLANGAGALDATGLFVTPTAKPPSAVALEDNAAEWHFVNNLNTVETPLNQNLGAIAGGDNSHVAYTIAQVQGVLDYIGKSEPDAAFASKFAVDITHVATAGAAALQGLNDLLTNGGTPALNSHYAHDAAEISAANVDMTAALHDLTAHNMPPPNFWLV